MNPLFMQMMFNPMGMGCMPFMGGMNFMMPSLFCGSSFMSMPYSQSDNLWFLNQPIYRNTGYDYLLDPNFALRNCQLKWQNGGFYGQTMLPGFTFPGFSPIGSVPQIPGLTQQPQKTEAEKEAEKKKAEEAKKPAAKKAQKLSESFANIKKLAEDKNNNLPEIPEELSKKAEEAMKKETAEEQLTAMKEVMTAIPEETIRKSVLADKNVRDKLRNAGYNFTLGVKNKCCLKNNDIKDEDIDNSKRLIRLHSDIIEKKLNELPLICGQLSNPDTAKLRILGIISSWNDKYKGSESGILRLIASNLPEGNDAVAKKDAVKECVKTFTEALLLKASDYEGYDKITKARDEVNEKLNLVLKTSPADGFTMTNINNLAAACDKLYARLRMQEAVAARDYVNKNFGYLNEVKPGVINENMIVEETQKDLEAEGIAYPKVTELDAAPVTDEIVVQTEQEMKDLDEEFDGDGKGKLEALYKDGKLTKVEGKDNIYQSKPIKAGDKVRYFAVIEDKVYEVFKQNDKFLKAKNAEEVSAADIGSYAMAVERANKLVDKNALRYVTDVSKANRYPVFKATGANEYYIIKDNKFYHLLDAERIYIKRVGNTDKVFVDFKGADRKEVSIYDITADDVEEFEDSEIRTQKQVDAEKKAKALEDVTIVESHQYSSLHDIESNEEMDKLSEEICGEKGHFRKNKFIPGYFMSDKPQGRVYKYDVKSGKLKFVENIRAITSVGYAKDADNKDFAIAEVFMDKEYTGAELINKIQEYGAELRTCLNGRTNDEEVILSHRKLSTIIAMKNPVYTINFIKGYKNQGGFWSSDGICKQIVTENDFDRRTGSTTLTGAYYVKQIAILIKQVVEITDFDRNSDDYKILCKLANGDNLSGSAEKLDDIIDKVIEAYDKKYS